MTEQEAESAEEAAERRWPGRFAEEFKKPWKAGFLLGWGMALSPSRHSPRVVEAAPSDTDHAQHGRAEEYVAGCPACEANEELRLRMNAETMRSRASQPVQVEEAKCEHGIALSDLCMYVEKVANEPQSVQVEVTDTMIQRLREAVAAQAGGYYLTIESAEIIARAALGGGK